ncbi:MULTISPECIES: HNH endonuclease signature motif containing protein [Ralstonia]|uniref:HNH endonuclease signature motif containing protein n=1 Tax=Ralstonia TaxID=48736 RepID=UPI000C7C4B5C|nr:MULTISPECIES: HNH endonuclease signature motif containing protein [Ralstonia]PLT16460.1 hypothetical protein CXP34_20200 [Ralstonia mannitolilytica]
MNDVFFPDMVRSESYERKEDGTYYDYTYYREVILVDCKERCVYCDIVLSEMGYEGMVLDHFRPQKKFPLLKNDPSNLVSACPKCNRLKSQHWPIPPEQNATHDNVVGFIDPFFSGRGQYFFTQEDGTLLAARGPSEYLIKLLNLNRESRKIIRRRRILRARLTRALVRIDESLETILAMLQRDLSPAEKEHVKGKLADLRALNSSVQAFLV